MAQVRNHLKRCDKNDTLVRKLRQSHKMGEKKGNKIKRCEKYEISQRKQ